MLRSTLLAATSVALLSLSPVSVPALMAQDEATQDESGQASGSTEAERLSVADILKLHAAGVGDDVIVAKIHASGEVFSLDVDEIVRLKRAGLSDRVLAELVRTAVHEEHLEAVEEAREIERTRPRVIVTPDYWYAPYGSWWWHRPWRYRHSWRPHRWGYGYGHHTGYHGYGGHIGFHWSHGSSHHDGTSSDPWKPRHKSESFGRGARR
jgi:hypothetical protein